MLTWGDEDERCSRSGMEMVDPRLVLEGDEVVDERSGGTDTFSKLREDLEDFRLGRSFDLSFE